jgi:Ice-binding-like
VFWKVGSSATLGTNSSFAGNILASASITLTSGSGLEGRALALDAAVTSDNNAVGGCAR